jgi:hypothetical protein
MKKKIDQCFLGYEEYWYCDCINCFVEFKNDQLTAQKEYYKYINGYKTEKEEYPSKQEIEDRKEKYKLNQFMILKNFYENSNEDYKLKLKEIKEKVDLQFKNRTEEDIKKEEEKNNEIIKFIEESKKEPKIKIPEKIIKTIGLNL